MLGWRCYIPVGRPCHRELEVIATSSAGLVLGVPVVHALQCWRGVLSL